MDDNEMAEFTMTAGNPWVRDDARAIERLALVGVAIGAEDVAAWGDDQVKGAEVWAWLEHLASAGDCDAATRPAFVPAPTIGVE